MRGPPIGTCLRQTNISPGSSLPSPSRPPQLADSLVPSASVFLSLLIRESMSRAKKPSGDSAVKIYASRTRSGVPTDDASVPAASPRHKPPAKNSPAKTKKKPSKAELARRARDRQRKAARAAGKRAKQQSTKANGARKRNQLQSDDEDSFVSDGADIVPRKKGGMKYSEGKRYADHIEKNTNLSYKDCGEETVALARRAKLGRDVAPKIILICDMNAIDFIQCKWCGLMRKPSTCSKHTHEDCKYHPWNHANRSTPGNGVVTEGVHKDHAGEAI